MGTRSESAGAGENATAAPLQASHVGDGRGWLVPLTPQFLGADSKAVTAGHPRHGNAGDKSN